MHPKTRHTRIPGCVMSGDAFCLLHRVVKLNLDKMHADDRMKGLIGDYWCLRANTVQIPLTVR